MINVNFGNCEKEKDISGLWQYDYGQVLRIQGLKLPTAVEIHFSMQSKSGDSVTRVGVTRDGVTDVVIPDSMLENNDINIDYSIYAFIYLTDETSGETVYKICMRVRSRPKSEAFDTPEDAELFRDAIAAVNEAADRAETAESNAEQSEKDAAGHLKNTGILAQQVAEDKTQITAMKEQVADNAKAVKDNTDKVASDAEAVAENKKQVEEKTSLTEEKAAQVSENTAKVESLTEKAEAYMEAAKRNVQSDLSINDETDPGYVKGRTHWSEGEQLVDIITETTFEGVEVEQIYTQPLGLKVGETYIVKINGVTYENVAIEADLSGLGVNQIIVTDNFEDIGNMHYILAESPGGMDGVYAMLNVVPDGATSHTVSVSCKSEVIHKLDNKFLDLDWLPVIDETEVLLAAKKTVTNHTVTPTETKGGFPDLTSSDVNEGDGLVVYFDGVRYPVTVTKITEISFAGNLYLISDQYPNTGEPFLLNFASTRTNVTCDDNSHTASVYALIKNVNKLPEKFLPESVDSVILRSSTADSTKLFSLTVDDSGTIKATEITE